MYVCMYVCMYDKLRTWMKVVVSYFKVQSQHFTGDFKETEEDLCLDGSRF
jgi:hypothetical protein